MKSKQVLSVVIISAILFVASVPIIPVEAAKPGAITVTVKSAIPGDHGGIRGATVTMYAASSLSGSWTLLGTGTTGGGGKITFTGGAAYPNGVVRFTVSYPGYGTYNYPPIGGFHLDKKGSASITVPFPAPW